MPPGEVEVRQWQLTMKVLDAQEVAYDLDCGIVALEQIITRTRDDAWRSLFATLKKQVENIRSTLVAAINRTNAKGGDGK
ncbi:MAG: hypothetical protein H5U03_00130 [Clostridia bacterium]|nr:hypothetical protein [Clostridia bacterium]